MNIIKNILRTHRNKKYFADPFQHKRMLADENRCSAYEEAIRGFVKKEHDVVDVGTGTGFLARSAARYARHVWAIDRNNIFNFMDTENITYRQQESTRFDHTVDVIIHELFGSYLFNENVIRIVADIRDRCLKPDGFILPNMCSLFLSTVKIKERFKVFLHKNAWEKLPFQAYRKFLSEHFVLSVNFMSVQKSYNGKEFSITINIQEPIDGVCLFFRVDFGNNIGFKNLNALSSWYVPFWYLPINPGRYTIRLLGNLCDEKTWSIHCTV